MPTRSDVEQLRAANAAISRLVRSEVAALWASLNPERDPDAARWALLQAMPGLVDRYGDIAASVSAEWYDEMRAKAEATGRYRALPAPHVIVRQVEKATGWASRDVLSPEQTVSGLQVVANRLVLQQGRDTIARNAKRENIRWARVPAGDETCAFCLMLASRGFAYDTEHSASRQRDGNKYHGDCDCVPTPSWGKADQEIEGYAPDALYQTYLNARGDISNAFDTKGILSRLREQQGIH
ncbi:hypothetical protein [Aeromicrobium sp. Leaf291]|uniref:VG15 protein n=1 Tax=Aeromicrobium sp. Leaf291 TaxID=1736325 RepID=UPI0006F44671|nr:hypothetical protein [Aeromicrobium sp. Leaf291]KQP83750.1 hypothetical protein ASF35_01865 [Aeromicrobium sp. Leaf291]